MAYVRTHSKVMKQYFALIIIASFFCDNNTKAQTTYHKWIVFSVYIYMVKRELYVNNYSL